MYMLDYLNRLANKPWHQKAYIYGLYLSYFLYIVALLGITTFKPEYLNALENILKYYICIILIVKFNPFVKPSNKEFDRHVAFEAGIFLLLTTTTGLVQKYIKEIKNVFSESISKVFS